MMKFCLIRDTVTYSWKKNGPAGTLWHNISHAYLGWWGSNGLFLIHFVLFLRFLTIECELPSQLEPWIWLGHLFTKSLSLEWIPDGEGCVNSCHRLSPIPVVPNAGPWLCQRRVLYGTQKAAWDWPFCWALFSVFQQRCWSQPNPAKGCPWEVYEGSQSYCQVWWFPRGEL